MAEDLETRVTLLEKTAMSREAVVEREERLLERIDVLLNRHAARSEETMQHTLKLFGHDIADQLQKMRARIHEERDERVKAEIAILRSDMQQMPPPAHNARIRAFMAANWTWIAAIIILVAVLRPDLAGSVLRLLRLV